MPARACLIIDDDPIATTWLLELLRARGHVAVLSGSLAQAESQLSDGEFARIIVDRRLPDGDGLKWLQQRSQALPRPVLLTSGDELSGAEMPDGVVFLRKPVDQDSLLQWLEADNIAGASPIPEHPAPAQAAELAILSDEPALTRLGGRIQTLQSLRLMLLKELQTAQGWISMLQQPQALPASLGQLHRLSAACALTGCVRLERISSELESALRAGHDLGDAQQRHLETTLAQTLSALEHSTSASVSAADHPGRAQTAPAKSPDLLESGLG